MTIDTRYTAAIRNALLEKMHDTPGHFAPDGSRQTDQGPLRGGAAGDSVSLSADALRIHDAAQADTGPEIDWQRVQSIRAAIADGSFTIDPARVADRFHRFNSGF